MSTAIRWRDYVRHLPPYAPKAPLDPEHLALLIVDMQYSSAGPDSIAGRFLRDEYPQLFSHYFTNVERAIPKILQLMRWFRTRKRRVLFLTVSSHLPDGQDFEPQRRGREERFESEVGKRAALAYRGQPDARIIEELAPREGDLVLNKVSLGAFNSTGIDQILRNMGINSLVVAGVVTNGCVAATAVDASDRGYRTVIVEDACAAIDSVLHESALLNFAHLYGRVVTTAEVVSELEGSFDQGSTLLVTPTDSQRGAL